MDTEQQGVTGKLEMLGVYCEKSFNGDWCYKHQFPGQDVVMVAHPNKEKAAGRFFVIYLQSLHYAIRWLYEEKRIDELKVLIEKMKSYNEGNINKTIEILLNAGVKY